MLRTLPSRRPPRQSRFGPQTPSNAIVPPFAPPIAKHFSSWQLHGQRGVLAGAYSDQRGPNIMAASDTVHEAVQDAQSQIAALRKQVNQLMNERVSPRLAEAAEKAEAAARH